VGKDFELPGVARQAGGAFLLVGQGVRQRLAARHVAELLLRREERFELLQGAGELRRRGRRLRRRQQGRRRRGQRRPRTEEVAARQLGVFVKEVIFLAHGRFSGPRRQAGRSPPRSAAI